MQLFFFCLRQNEQHQYPGCAHLWLSQVVVRVHVQIVQDVLVPNGRRRGPDTRGESAGKSDVICDGWAPEVKLLARPSFSDLLAAARQAERNAGELQTPVAVVKRKYDDDGDALVTMRLEQFEEWFLC